MSRLYQRGRAIAALSLCLVSCGAESEPVAPRASPQPADAASLHRASKSYSLVDAGSGSGPALVDEIGATACRAVLIDLVSGGVTPIAPPTIESRGVALFPTDDRVLVEVALDDGESGLRVRSGDGVLSPLPPPTVAAERFLGWRADGGAFFTAGSIVAGTTSLFEISTAAPVRRELERFAAGFEIAVVDPAAEYVALVRQLDRARNEVILRDRRSGESRLLLPLGADGRFVPQQFLGDPAALLVITTDQPGPARLESIDLDTGSRRAVASFACPPVSAQQNADGSLIVDLSCAGHREVRLVAPDGLGIASPTSPAGTRLVSTGPNRSAANGRSALLRVIEFAGARWPAEVARIDDSSLPVQLTYGLAPRLNAAGNPRPTPATPASAAGGKVPCEIWRPSAPPVRATLLFEDERRPPRWGEYTAWITAAVAAGETVMRCRGDDTSGAGIESRRGVDFDHVAATRADLSAAISALRSALPAGAPWRLVGEGAWWGSAVLALASSLDTDQIDQLDQIVAITPDDSWFLASSSLPDAPPAARGPDASRASGQPSREQAEPATPDPQPTWNLAAGSIVRPTVIALPAGRLAATRVARFVELARLAGAPLQLVRFDRPEWPASRSRLLLDLVPSMPVTSSVAGPEKSAETGAAGRTASPP